ncbi:MAG TPA: ATP--guanido phosphotransferase [bacterium]|nr:ATP--guanido phosphotransferase [bacterium]
MKNESATLEVRALADKVSAWLVGSGPQSDVVLSSRVRLARNLREVPFPQRASDLERSKTFERVVDAARGAQSLGRAFVWNVEALPAAERRLLVERHLVSPNLLQGEGARGVLVRGDEKLGLMVNEEDHLRIQSVTSGLDLEGALRPAVALDRELETRLEFAATRERGYLTACPTNVGTGLRASVLVHLPALVLVGEIKKMHRAVSELGMTVRGWFGEGSNVLGDYYQLSNQKTLGKTESESCQELLRVTKRTLELEEEARKRFRNSASMMRRVEDRIWRAWGTLRNARLLSVEQVMACASDLRLGRALGIFEGASIETLNRLNLFVQPAHLRQRMGGKWDSDQENWERARWIRGELRESGPSRN